MNTGIARTKEWFNAAVPAPTLKTIHTQLGCHFEEVAEMLCAMTGRDRITQAMLTQTTVALHALAMHMKTNGECFNVNDPLEMLDGLCDQIVTATGAAHMLGYDVVGALDEVNASNFSKFVEGRPLFDENRKIKKGPNFFCPDLSKYLRVET